MCDILRLSEISEDEKCIVKSIEANVDIRRRLQDMGLIPGTLVQCVFKSPYGDPTAYLIRGALVALRKTDADNILVSYGMGDV
ncbi:MAG: ferrous iron transport protein A [Clostridia bacterium]|nr:ferrous iron transport protein A [Clostridia bacterium]